MRLYTLTNMYISDIQRGIQTAHIVSELASKPDPLFQQWAENHKTIIVLNGGYQSAMEEAYETTFNPSIYPSAKFYEEEAALGGALTAVGVVVPEHVYQLSSFINKFDVEDVVRYRSSETWKLDPTDFFERTLQRYETDYSWAALNERDIRLAHKLSQFRLA